MNIKEMADRSEEFTYSKDLSKDELLEISDRKIQAEIEFNEKEAQFNDVKADFSQVKKGFQKSNSELLGMLKDKKITVTETCYLVPNYSDRRMEYFNEDGVMVYSRILYASESNMRIDFKEGTND
jgi:hypothetical protein